MFNHCLTVLSDPVKVKAEPKKEKDAKPQPKSQSKANAKKTSNRRSPAKKEKNGVSAADIVPPEPADGQAAGGSEEHHPASSSSPAHRLFQRTLSPADVLHVHSYAKGDYGEGDTPAKEERRSDSSDNEAEREDRQVGSAASHCNTTKQARRTRASQNLKMWCAYQRCPVLVIFMF